MEGNTDRAFEIACATVEELADFSCGNTNPGLVIVDDRPDPAFYQRAVKDFCEIADAIRVLDDAGACYRGWKNRRGLIGATAAVASELPDRTSEILVYRKQERWGTPREVERESLFDAENATFPHTWDTADVVNDVVVCVPHTPDPGTVRHPGREPGMGDEGPAYDPFRAARHRADLGHQPGDGCPSAAREDRQTGELRSYIVPGKVTCVPGTYAGGHVSFIMKDGGIPVRCMAYEPTKNFRHIVRQLIPGDKVIAVGSFKKGSINLEKIKLVSPARSITTRPPVCPVRNKRMTSDGKGKGWKCKKCGAKAGEPDVQEHLRALAPDGEVPPTARRHLARRLCRGLPE